LITAVPGFVCAEDSLFNLGRFGFFLSPKILKDGSVTDIGLSFAYNDTLSGELRFRNTAIAKNEELLGVADSLNAVNENIFEIFLLPVQYRFASVPIPGLRAGAGLYYEYDKLREKGFFNMPSLETLDPPRERVNSYTNDFSMHLFGPLLEAGAGYSSRLFSVDFSAGLVPVFFLNASQKTGITPLLDPNRAEYSQNTWGSPHFYLSLDGVIFRYVNLALFWNYARLQYQGVDFDENLNWINPQRTVVTSSFRIEVAALVPLGGDMAVRIGYGHMFDSTRLDSAVAVSVNRPYMILAVKKTGN
jgi:hypothetical protein